MTTLIGNTVAMPTSGELLIMDVGDWRPYWREVAECVDGSLDPGFYASEVFREFGSFESTSATVADLVDAETKPSSGVVLGQAFPQLGTELSLAEWEEAGVAFLAQHTFEGLLVGDGDVDG